MCGNKILQLVQSLGFVLNEHTEFPIAGTNIMSSPSCALPGVVFLSGSVALVSDLTGAVVMSGLLADFADVADAGRCAASVFGSLPPQASVIE